MWCSGMGKFGNSANSMVQRQILASVDTVAKLAKQLKKCKCVKFLRSRSKNHPAKVGLPAFRNGHQVGLASDRKNYVGCRFLVTLRSLNTQQKIKPEDQNSLSGGNPVCAATNVFNGFCSIYVSP